MKRSLLLAVTLLGCASSVESAPPQPKSAPPTATVKLGDVPEPPTEAPPLGRLGLEVKPSRYALELDIDPGKDRFAGKERIEVDVAHARKQIWMHGRGLSVTRAQVTPKGGAPIAATWTQVHESGVASLTLDASVPAGAATIEIEWSAPFGHQLEGLYRVDRKDDHYAFTQFEAISARRAFPCFDEPAFKTPFDVKLSVPKGLAAIANTHELSQQASGDRVVKTFAATAPLPTYLLAWAVGPLDVVEGKPVPPNAARKQALPLRGVAARGRGKELAYALEHAGKIVSTLEDYFGIAYPYEKLDLLAVPDREGAMENAGAITFTEWLLLVDEKGATVGQKRGFASVVAHELAHQWFGDLVTMPWWDDIWLNEAFATWMAAKAMQTFAPDGNSELNLVDRVHDAMGSDSLVSARAIRQPIESEHDILNAFDSITYSKGAGVLSMFERWIGKETFRAGIQAYLRAHANGNATSADLLSALSAAAKKDVATPFRSFLDKPGVPVIDAKLACEGKEARLEVKQSRYLPFGSKGDAKQLWQVPVCVRFGDKKGAHESCSLVTEAQASIPLGGTCPDWVQPNSDAAGYYRFTLPKEALHALSTKGWSKLDTRDRLAVADAIKAAWSRGAPADEVFPAVAALASEDYPSVASSPMGVVTTAREWLHGTALEAKVEAYARRLYSKPFSTLGWDAKKGESAEAAIRRSSDAWFLAFVAKDPAVRKEGSKRGRAYVEGGAVHPEAVDPNLAGIALSLAVQEGDAAFFDRLLAMLEKTDDDVVRSRLLGALSSAVDPQLAARARALSLDPRLHVNEVTTPIWTQIGQLETRDATWAFVQEKFDALAARVSHGRAAGFPWTGARFCDEKHVAEVESFFAPRIESLEGGPRNLAGALESMRLCVARRSSQEASVRAFFTKTP